MGGKAETCWVLVVDSDNEGKKGPGIDFRGGREKTSAYILFPLSPSLDQTPKGHPPPSSHWQRCVGPAKAENKSCLEKHPVENFFLLIFVAHTESERDCVSPSICAGFTMLCPFFCVLVRERERVKECYRESVYVSMVGP